MALPVAASSAKSRRAAVTKMRCSVPSVQYTTPRFACASRVRPTNGSNVQTTVPLSARNATTFSAGVVVYITPPTMIGVAWISDRPAGASPVWYVHATCSCFTFARVIWSSDE